MTTKYEPLRERHAETRPMRHLHAGELDALAALTGVRGPLRDLAFLATCERQERHAAPPAESWTPTEAL